MRAGVALAEDVLGGQLVGLGHLGSVPAPACAQLLCQSLVALQVGLRRLSRTRCRTQTWDEIGGSCLPAGRTEQNHMLGRGLYNWYKQSEKDLSMTSASNRRNTLCSIGAPFTAGYRLSTGICRHSCSGRG